MQNSFARIAAQKFRKMQECAENAEDFFLLFAAQNVEQQEMQAFLKKAAPLVAMPWQEVRGIPALFLLLRFCRFQKISEEKNLFLKMIQVSATQGFRFGFMRLQLALLF